MFQVAFISPHLDDAVFSCGTLIAALATTQEVAVITVLGDDDERAQEDIRACTLLGAEAYHLGLPEGSSTAEIEVALMVGDAIVFAPVGIRHRDHVTVAAATRHHATWLYEELPYRVLWPEYLLHPPVAPTLELPTSSAKQAAIACYRSQLGDGPAGEALWAGERYRRVSA